MVTRIYLHNTNNSLSNQPTTKQSAQTIAAGSANTVTVNKLMSTTIGTTQTSIAFTSTATGYMYLCRWTSDILQAVTISANTWTFSFGYDTIFGSTDNGVRICIFVWRPSTQTKVGNICDANVSQAFTTTETGYKLTVAGSAVTALDNDILCVEFMTNSVGSGGQIHFYYDGNTAVTTNNTASSSVASYIESPQTFTIGAPASLNCTVTTINLQNKFIMKI